MKSFGPELSALIDHLRVRLGTLDSREFTDAQVQALLNDDVSDEGIADQEMALSPEDLALLRQLVRYAELMSGTP